ncbi:response regulator [Rhabdochromatium marinum]|uniref:response regulator n=1 Tax=Rhabdochromatium marinum TaxID=48729 RepID=UPI001908A344|nr:response regulator [Rhabdochromatium marinum]MBK1650062.1 hypothetical protein [Rhabdochromatium marinum]
MIDPVQPCGILIVEDNPADARLIRESLHDARGDDFQLTLVTSLERARNALLADSFDAILLDLELPDSQGETTLTDVLTLAGRAPIIVITGAPATDLGERLIALGAEDYLSKNEAHDNGELLKRALRYAIERSRLRRRAEMAEAVVRRERERRDIEQIGLNTPGSSEVARLYDAAPLRESDASLFNTIVEDYISLVTREASSQVYKTAQRDRAGHIKALAKQLGFLGSGPRDVIAIHTEALRAIAERVPASDERLISLESRLVVLELMGYLVSFYRRYYWNSPAHDS